MQRPPRTFLPLTASLLALLMLGSAALAQDPARRGRAILKEFCAGCHAIGKTDKSRREGALPLRELGRSYDLDKFPRVLERGISSSHPGHAGIQVQGARRPRRERLSAFDPAITSLSFRDAAQRRARNPYSAAPGLWIPGSRPYRPRPGMTKREATDQS